MKGVVFFRHRPFLTGNAIVYDLREVKHARIAFCKGGRVHEFYCFRIVVLCHGAKILDMVSDAVVNLAVMVELSREGVEVFGNGAFHGIKVAFLKEDVLPELTAFYKQEKKSGAVSVIGEFVISGADFVDKKSKRKFGEWTARVEVAKK